MLQEMNLSSSLDEPEVDPSEATILSDAIVQARESLGSPRLFSVAVKPSGQVMFSVDHTLGKIRVEFQGTNVPLDNVTSPFDIFPGSVAFRVKSNAAEAHYAFKVQPFDQKMNPIEILETMLTVEVAENGPLDKIGFACSDSQPIILQTLLTMGSATTCQVMIANMQNEDSYLNLFVPGQKEFSLHLKPSQIAMQSVPVQGFGGMLRVKVVKNGSSESVQATPPSNEPKEVTQSGGTEQFEIIIEPD